MKIVQAASVLRPGTAWVTYTDSQGNVTLSQAVDGSPRVDVPTMDEINAVIAANS